ncbi:MAG: PfkB family carbohydrate kinase [bacterium]
MASIFKKIFNNGYDMITIGDIAVDAFIKIEQARESINPITGHRELGLAFGEKIPYTESREVFAVGNSGNVAVACSRLGMNTGIISNVGSDLYGQKSIEKLKAEGVDGQFVKINQGKKTNYHYILWYKDDRTILTKHEEYSYSLPSAVNTKWLYLSSLSEHSAQFHKEIESYLDKNKNVKLIFQPGTYQLKMGLDTLKKIYARSELFFCNLEEAEMILGLEIVKASSSASERAQNIKRLLLEIFALGVSLPVITDGSAGSYVLIDDELYNMPIYNDTEKPVERNGAGDAFSATFSVCHTRGMSVEDCLKWASVNAMSVCQHIGSHEGLLKDKQIQDFLAKAPKGWGLTKM